MPLDGGRAARLGPAAGAGGEAAREGLGALEGPSIPLRHPPFPVPRWPSSWRRATPSRRDPPLPWEPDGVSATSFLVRGGDQGRAAVLWARSLPTRLSSWSVAAKSYWALREAARDSSAPRGGSGRQFPKLHPGLEPRPGLPALRALEQLWAALDLCKVLDAVLVASLQRHGPLPGILALPGTVLLINKLETISDFFPHYPQTIII